MELKNSTHTSKANIRHPLDDRGIPACRSVLPMYKGHPSVDVQRMCLSIFRGHIFLWTKQMHAALITGIQILDNCKKTQGTFFF